MTMGQGVELGPVSLPIYRMLLLVGAAALYLVLGDLAEGLFLLAGGTAEVHKSIIWRELQREKCRQPQKTAHETITSL